ncbi:MAG TPA: alpha/beta hydrolase [Acidimicrobiales bacterium]|jgi:acetyl esterase|nr:alpha/beta hydrolase [Acidimicrobiales bacterium]
MPLDPRVRPIVKLLNTVDRSERDHGQTMTQQRIESAGVARRFHGIVMRLGDRSVTSQDQMVPVAGGQITVRIHRPPAPGPLPLHVFFHGGGWCAGTLEERDPRCRAIASGATCAVASVDYRMAPENQYPTPPEDCYAALTWLVDHAGELGVDPARVSVGGESAGANLAAVVCLMARDRSGPALCHQWLDVPATDLTMEQPSVRSTPAGYLLDYEAMLRYRDAYLPDPEAQMREPYASPFHAPDLSGLAPAWILTCGYDPLRDDGRVYAERLRAAGVPVEHTHLEGHVHPSFAFTRLVPSAREYEAAAIAALAAAYAR